MHILHTVQHTFLKVPTGRICLFPLLVTLACDSRMMFKGKLDDSHSQGVSKGLLN